MGVAKGNRRAMERWLPIAYLAVVVVLAVAVLPSTLRPPNQQPNETAELSPDAPPDQKQEAFITAFNQASSGTAGSGTGTPAQGAAGPLAPGVAPQPQQSALPRACPRGVGNPPRQTENVYGPPCAPPFSGNNGGATWRGVSAGEIRINVQGTGDGNQPSKDGQVNTRPDPSENAWDRTYRVIQQYFNQNFQLYGRQLRFYVSRPASYHESDEQNAAIQADTGYKVYGSGFTSEPECAYFAQHQIVAFCEQNPKSFYASHDPYNFGWYMNGTELISFTSEYLCKKLAGKPAAWAGDPTYQKTRRKFGFLLYDTRGYWELGAQLQREVKEQCNEDVDLVGYNQDDQNGQARLAAAVAHFKTNGVTTIIPGMDWVSAALFTNAAEQGAWFPEWFTDGGGALDRNQLAQLQNQDEWQHAFGVTALDMERRNDSTDCYRAYKSVDPSNTPNYVFCTYVYASLFALVSGIQQAGPTLNPSNFKRGIMSLGYRFPDHPAWAIGGGFGPDDWTYTDNVTEIWWDRNAVEPNFNTAQGQRGAYKYTRSGQRYRLGDIPRENPNLFGNDGVTEVPDSNEPG